MYRLHCQPYKNDCVSEGGFAMIFEIYDDEYWWGGCVCTAEKMPFDKETVFTFDLQKDKRTQTAPLFLSSKGRYLWSDEPFIIDFNRGTVTVTGRGDITLSEAGITLRDAYLRAMKRHFPFEKNIHIPREYIKHPQFNTWMELIKNQNQGDILKYAHEIVENGYNPGILTIDGGWQICQGTWEFKADLIPDPKAMVDELHSLGFKVMIWVSPFVCSEGENFLKLYSKRSSEVRSGEMSCNHLVRREDGEVSIQKWWSGFGAILNFNLPGDCEFLDLQLQRLMNEYGFDGFKFDGGMYMPQSFLNGCDFYGGYTLEQLNDAWIRFGSKYKYHEYKDTWKQGGRAVIQRLCDKEHSWEQNGIDCLIPHGCFVGLIGCPFICPDMVGGGEWTAFIYGEQDEELFVRMAQASALFPMMQFSALPWRRLSPENSNICKSMAELHEKLYPEIEKALADAEQTGEPILRSMEYMYPGLGYEKVNTQFMLGENIISAPVLKKGETSKTVYIPEGNWEDMNSGKIYTGPCVVQVEAPINTLPWFKSSNK